MKKKYSAGVCVWVYVLTSELDRKLNYNDLELLMTNHLKGSQYLELHLPELPDRTDEENQSKDLCALSEQEV